MNPFVPSGDITPLVAHLNDAQKRAVTAPPEHRLVLAGAGSGKTRVLVHRIAWLIAVEGVSPLSILAVTFTNKAANEMRGRIEQLITTPARQLWVGTFHGIAHRMLRLHWNQARLKQDFQILDADDQQRLVKRIIRQLELPEDQWPAKQATAWINGQKEEGRRPEQLQDVGDFAQRNLVRIYTAYQQTCEAQGLVDFAELLLRAYELCRDNAEIQAHYHHKFRHVLVDEFQDTNTLQYLWLKLLVGEQGLLFAVGDDDQCLAAGTPVAMADGGCKAIESVQVGERVKAAFGTASFRAAAVTERICIGQRTDLVAIATRSGRRLVSTPEHTHFAGYLPGETPQIWFTYLMHKRGVGYRLGVSQHGLSAKAPHHHPGARDVGRRKVVVTLCGQRRGAKPMHRISIVGNDAFGREALELAGLPIRPAGSARWRFEACRRDFGELLQIAERARKALDGDLLLNARIGRRLLPFIPASAVRAGMVMLAEDGSFDVVTQITREQRPTVVYDLNIEGVHNFVAGGLVTHNSVYGWRGAKVENMLKLQREFKGLEVLRLEQNYRSTGTILKAANGLIARNSGRLGKNLWTEGSEGAPIALYAAFNEYDEAEFVVSRIKEHLEGPLRHSDVAVLYRSNAQSRVLEEMLIRARLPYRIYGGQRFFERMEVKDALAWLRLLTPTPDDVSFERALSTPPRGIGATSLERLREAARGMGLTLWQTAKRDPKLLGRTAAAMLAFTDRVDQLRQDSRDKSLSEAMELVIERSGLREHYHKGALTGSGASHGGGEQAEGRLENLDELVSAARSFERPDEEGVDPLSAFLAHAALEAGEGQATAGEDCVQLMTLHAAKGLEFPVVFIVGMELNLLPSMRAVEKGDIEEERRLCYVGITRARQQLYLSYAEVRRVHGVEQIGMPSPFLKEIPAECVVETRPRAGILRPAPFGGRYGGREPPAGARYGGRVAAPPSRSSATSAYGPGGFKLGQRVAHARFGEGVILSFEGDGERAQVEVRFRDSGVKRLMLSFAKLDPL